MFAEDRAVYDQGAGRPLHKMGAGRGSRGGPTRRNWVSMERNRDLLTEITAFAPLERAARQRGADAGNAAMRRVLSGRKRLRPRTSTSRPGRSTEPLQGNLEWVASRSGKGSAVGLSRAKADRVRFWKILEIGTGKSAVQRRGAPNGVGRPRNEGPMAQQITIPSQRGRRLSIGLGFGPGPGGRYYSPSSARQGRDAVHWTSQLEASEGQPLRRIVIRKEIAGVGMVRQSGSSGFLEYRTKALEAGRTAFAGANHRR